MTENNNKPLQNEVKGKEDVNNQNSVQNLEGDNELQNIIDKLKGLEVSGKEVSSTSQVQKEEEQEENQR